MRSRRAVKSEESPIFFSTPTINSSAACEADVSFIRRRAGEREEGGGGGERVKKSERV